MRFLIAAATALSLNEGMTPQDHSLSNEENFDQQQDDYDMNNENLA